ncbi:MAG: hypothetical protein Q9170_001822 [Blastenia crenularia]
MTTTMSFRFLDLPREIRDQVYSHLLPDLPVIDCDPDWSTNKEGLYRYSAYDFRADREPCSLGLLMANHQLYDEGTDYLYNTKTYKLNVFAGGFDFLSESNSLERLPAIPCHKIKAFVIRIVDCDFEKSGCELRENLVWLCGLLRHHNVCFKDLKIVFSKWAPGWSGWSEAWDANDTEEPSPPVVNDNIDNKYNANLAAWELNFFWTFDYIISPLALLPVADKCTIEVPEVFKGQQHVVDRATWYEEGLNGCAVFEDDKCLQSDRAEFEQKFQRAKHLYGELCRPAGYEQCPRRIKAASSDETSGEGESLSWDIADEWNHWQEPEAYNPDTALSLKQGWSFSYLEWSDEL